MPYSDFISEFNSLLSGLNRSLTPYIICGDFNIRWNIADDSKTIAFKDLLDEYGTVSCTPESKTHTLGNTIDFILVDPSLHSSNGISEARVDVHETLSDHFPVHFSCLLTKAPPEKPQKIKYVRKLKNIHEEFFNMDIISSLSKNFPLSGSFEEQVNAFDACLSEVLETHAPLVACKTNHDPRPGWMDHEYSLERATRRSLENQSHKTGDPEDRALFVEQRSYCSLLADHKRTKFYQKHITDNRGNQRVLFQVFNDLLDSDSNSHTMPDTLDGVALANKFNESFINKIDKIHSNIEDNALIDIKTKNDKYVANSPIVDITDKANNKNLPINNNNNNEDNTPDPPIPGIKSMLFEFEPTTVDEIRLVVKESGIKTSPSDPLPSTVMKISFEAALSCLTIVVNSSLKHGTIEGVKEAIVRPLLKKAGLDYNDFLCFRPISNIPFVSKVIEKIVQRRTNTHLDLNNLNCDSQYGYKRNHGTETLLVHFVDQLLVAVDKKLGVVVLLIDLSAAFDTVCHSVLLRILSDELGIRGTALRWFKSFLTGRTQRVMVDGHLSEPIHLKFGVPQGSVLGPILFNLYTRSISKVFSSAGFSSSGYADDNSGLCAFTHHTSYDVIMNNLPECFEKLRAWMNHHFLKINETKTEIIIFGSQSFLSSNIINGTFLESGHCIRASDSVKYLGVHFDSLLNFNKHINSVSSSCYLFIRKLSSIRKFLSQKDCESLVHAFISSRLDSCNSLFFGLTKANISKLQKVQNAAIRVITFKKKRESVKECYQELHWLDVHQRISFKILLIVFKCIQGIAPASLQTSIVIKDQNAMTLETSYFPISNIGRRAFTFYAPRQWNSLPADLRRVNKLDTFKAHLKTHLFSKYPEFCQSYNKYGTLW